MTLFLPQDRPEHIDTPNDPAVIYAFVVDHIRDMDTVPAICRVEDSLHTRLRILREREQDPELIRQALVLCADRRRESVALGMPVARSAAANPPA